jgi:hypothetical protein
MGWHFLNPAYVDGAVEVLKPEVVIFEPEKNGELRSSVSSTSFPSPSCRRRPRHHSPRPAVRAELRRSGLDAPRVGVEAQPDGMFASWNRVFPVSTRDPHRERASDATSDPRLQAAPISAVDQRGSLCGVLLR